MPIYVTETGIADASDTLRPRLIETYYEQARAVQYDCTEAIGLP